jgi:hypothetical protein
MDIHRFKHLFNSDGTFKHENVREADSEDGSYKEDGRYTEDEEQEEPSPSEYVLNVPKQFLVMIDGVAEEPDGSCAVDFDLTFIVPKISINHFTYVLQVNGIPHRVEPLP